MIPDSPTEPLLKLKSLFSKRNLLVFIFVLVTVVAGVIAWLTLYPTETPENLVISNLTDQQVTISWTTKNPVKTQLLIQRQEFGFPFFALSGFRGDDLGVGLKYGQPTTLHYVTITNLSKNTTYYISIHQNMKLVYQKTFATAEPLPVMLSPQPVYGRVLHADKKTPILGAVIYFVVTKSGEASTSALLSTTTNLEGRWTIDMANLRTNDYKLPFELSDQAKEEVIVDVGKLGRVRAITSINRDQPWPDIFLSPRQKPASTSAQSK